MATRLPAGPTPRAGGRPASIAQIGNPHVEVAVVAGAGNYVRQQRAEAFHAVADPWLAEHLHPPIDATP